MLNGVLLQGFHWETVASGSLWTTLASRATELAERGFTSVWLPPVYKGAGGKEDVGYGVYDLFDLGEFDQKGSVRTKYGTKDELIACIAALQAAGLGVVADVVLNHRMGADAEESFQVVACHNEHRLTQVGEPFEGTYWTRFDYPGRGDQHSTFKWNFDHFVGVAQSEEGEVIRHASKAFATDVADQYENFDYLMGADVDFAHPEVRDELFAWGRWFIDTTKVNGLRMDAVKHMSAGFVKDFLNHLRTHFSAYEVFAVGEYWEQDVAALAGYRDATEAALNLFDVPLHQKLHDASKAGNDYDLSMILADTWVEIDPERAVTFVDNHDTQPGQSLESWVDDWFKAHAYALILLRRDGYPCVFAGDYDGGKSDTFDMTCHRGMLDQMLDLRERFNFGDQHDYLDHPHCVGWIRCGDEAHPGSMVVVMSNGDAGSKHMVTLRPNETFTQVFGEGHRTQLTTDDQGAADFTCPAGGVAVWVSDAHGTERWGMGE